MTRKRAIWWAIQALKFMARELNGCVVDDRQCGANVDRSYLLAIKRAEEAVSVLEELGKEESDSMAPAPSSTSRVVIGTITIDRATGEVLETLQQPLASDSPKSS